MITYNRDGSMTMVGSFATFAAFGDALLEIFMSQGHICSEPLNIEAIHIRDNIWKIGNDYCTTEVKDKYIAYCRKPRQS